jgi:hypothetical protein
LAAYAREYGVTFPLLSDPESEIIERFGILNTLVEPDDHPWYGIPFPGSYVVGADGTITSKFFESNLFLRANADQLLRAALGEEIDLTPLPESPSEVTVDIAFDGSTLGPGILRDLVIRLAVPTGQHLYGEPVASPMVATSVTFDDDVGLVTRPAVFPATTPHTLAGTGEALQIFDGNVTIRVPITQNGQSITRLPDGSRVQRVGGTVHWQACDAEACRLPSSHRFDLEIPVTRLNVFEMQRPEDSTRMDFAAHFTRMTERRA